MTGGRGGWSLTEVVVGLVLTGLLALVAAGAVEGHRRVLDGAILRAGEEESLRVVRGVLGEELSVGQPGTDWDVAGDSVVLRAFRGVARVCGPPLPGPLRVSYRGTRRPDPGKDSVRILGVDGRWRGARLVGASSTTGGCVGAADEEWTVEPAPPVAAVYARVHERGAYLLVDGALRYRRDVGGRQPLTPLFLSGGAGLMRRETGGIRYHLRVGARPVEGRVQGANP